MAKTKKTAGSGSSKPIADVAHPDTSAPSDTSKPIINRRPMIKDPMVIEGKDGSEDEKPLVRQTSELNVAPPSEAVDEKPETEEAPAEPEAKAEPAAEDTEAEEPDKKKPERSGPDAEAAAELAKDAKLQRIIDSEKYFLPINAVEQRRSKRVVTLGVVVALLLALAWVDIALDAGLIHLGGIKAVTHFFSN